MEKNLFHQTQNIIPDGVKNQVQVEVQIKYSLTLESVQDFFDQVGHETMYASRGNRHSFTESCHCHTYQNYEQSRQKSGTILGNILKNRDFQGIFFL